MERWGRGLDPHPPRFPFSLVREEGEGKVLDGDRYSPEGRLVIELDGGVHRLRVEEDRIRQAERAGYRVLRFGNDEV